MDKKKKMPVKPSSSVARLVAKCHLCGWMYPAAYDTFSYCWCIHLNINFQMYMYTTYVCANVDVGKIGNQLSKFSAKLVDVRKLRCAVSVLPGPRWWTCQTWSTLLASCTYIRVYVYDTVCLCIYVYEPVQDDKHGVRLVVRSISRDIVTFGLKALKSFIIR